MSFVITPNAWTSHVRSCALNTEDFGTTKAFEYEWFLFHRECLFMNSNYFQKRIGESTSEEYLLKQRKLQKKTNDLMQLHKQILEGAIN